MKSFPLPAIVAAFAAVVALPFSIVAAGTLAFTAALGVIINVDYGRRCRRVRLPQLAAAPCVPTANTRSPARREQHPFAA